MPKRQIILANGTTKRIDQVEQGDMVIATDPETGESGPREVIATLPHADQLLALRTSAGDIVTTEDHRYWNDTDQVWQESQHLDAGDQLLSADGDVVTVEGLDWSTAHTAPAYDLTVADLHTFYVATGDGVGAEYVLVHNSGLDGCGLGLKIDKTTGSQILDGPMPGRDAVRNWNPADRAELREMLETSIANRRADQVSGAFPSVDPGHTARIAQEQSLLDFLNGLR